LKCSNAASPSSSPGGGVKIGPSGPGAPPSGGGSSGGSPASGGVYVRFTPPFVVTLTLTSPPVKSWSACAAAPDCGSERHLLTFGFCAALPSLYVASPAVTLTFFGRVFALNRFVDLTLT
jgi:hypothetical protein